LSGMPVTWGVFVILCVGIFCRSRSYVLPATTTPLSALCSYVLNLITVAPPFPSRAEGKSKKKEINVKVK